MASSSPSHAQIEAAIQWHLYFQEHADVPSAHPAFLAWLQADVHHALAWQRIQHIYGHWQKVPKQALSQPVAQLAQLRQRPHTFVAVCEYWGQRVKTKKGLLAVLLMLFGGFLGLQQWSAWTPGADYVTDVGEVKVVKLEDGSELTLSGASAVKIRFTAQERLIELQRGRLLINVAKQANRPLWVTTDQGRAQAMGTIFSVEQLPEQQTEVIVLESKVNACADQGVGGDAVPACVLLTENQRVRLLPQGLGLVSGIDAEAEASWTKGLITATDMPLSALLATLNQHHAGQIQYDAQQLAPYLVSGVYALNDPEATLAAISLIQPIRVRRITEGLFFVDIDPRKIK